MCAKVVVQMENDGTIFLKVQAQVGTYPKENWTAILYYIQK